MQLKIATYNILHGVDYVPYKNGTTRINLEQIADVIGAQNVDICGLNEVDWNCKRSEYLNEPYQIAKHLTEKTGVKYHWAFAAGLMNHHGPGSQYGNAIVSRYPMQNVREISIDAGVGRGGGYEPRSLLVVDMEIDGKMLTVMNSHFGLTDKEKRIVIEKLRELIPANPYPVVLMGDFNFWPTEEYYADIAALLKDTSEDPALPLTFPSTEPNSKIDFIFTSESLKTSNVRVEPVLYSDHLPLLCDITW